MNIHCIIKPNTKHDEGVELIEETYVVRVKAPATEGKANDAAKRLLARYFAVPPSHVTLTAGRTSRYKTFAVQPLADTH